MLPKEEPAKVLRVGILSPAASETAATLTAFREGIRDLGYIEGKTITLDFRLSKGNMDALPALAAELARVPVNVIVTDSKPPRSQRLMPRALSPS
jgi:putative ABC transport system substrate-binding protein